MAFYRNSTKGHGPLDAVAVPFEALKGRIRQLYEGDTFGCIKFRYALLALDIVTVLFIIATSFLPRNRAIQSLDVVFGVLILADFAARMIISRRPLHAAMCRPMRPSIRSATGSRSCPTSGVTAC